MITLAVDTASEYGSAAIRADGRLLAETELHSREGFAHLIFEAIERCRKDAGVDLAAIDCFAAGAGPGSFTGVRVALSAVKAFAEALGKPAFAISNLRALSVFGARSTPRAVLLDARRTEVYSAVYGPDLALLVEESVGPLATFLESLGDREACEFIAPIGTVLPIGFTGAARALAAAIAHCAELDMQTGVRFDAASLDANYVRRSDAELFWTDQRLNSCGQQSLP